MDKHTKGWTDRQTDRHTYNTWVNGKMNRQMNGQTHRQKDRKKFITVKEEWERHTYGLSYRKIFHR